MASVFPSQGTKLDFSTAPDLRKRVELLAGKVPETIYECEMYDSPMDMSATRMILIKFKDGTEERVSVKLDWRTKDLDILGALREKMIDQLTKNLPLIDRKFRKIYGDI